MRRLSVFLALVVLCLSCAAPSLADEGPLDVVKRFYPPLKVQDHAPWSRRLDGLFNSAVRRSRELDEPVEGIDFDPSIDAQDTDDGWEKTLRFDAAASKGARASVGVSFVNGRPVRLRYDLVREGGAWRVDDIVSLAGGKPSSWAAMLARGAKTPRTP